MGSRAVTPKQFYVYTHARPDGSVFYIGKGIGRRAWSFSPSRRRPHHVNIARKHGLQNIRVEIIPCESETAAFEMERQLIEECRLLGINLINVTDGGEGTSGRVPSQKVLDAFKKQYGPSRVLSSESRQRILDGLARGREKNRGRVLTKEDHARRSKAARAAAAARLSKPPVKFVCRSCCAEFDTHNPAAKYCSKICGLRGWRAGQPKAPPRPRGPQTPEARKAIGDARRREAAARERARNQHQCRVPGQTGLPSREESQI